jgi:hypothetical protein
MMLCTFTTASGRTLVVRSEDIRSIEDESAEVSTIVWLVGNDSHSRTIQGTASENLARIQQEEIENVLKYQAQQQRMQNGYPVPPVTRGRR